MNPILVGSVGFLAGVIVASGSIITVVWRKVYLPYVDTQTQLNKTNWIALQHLQQYNAGLTETLEQFISEKSEPEEIEISKEDLSRGYV